MFNKPHILVCTDFSESSDWALLEAHRFVEKKGGDIQLLHIAELNFYLRWLGHGLLEDDDHKRFICLIYNDLMERMVAQSKRTGVECKASVLFEASAARGIKSFCMEKETSLILMGARGATSSANLIGSLVRTVINQAEIPVMVIKSATPVRKVAGLIGGSEELKTVITVGQELSSLYGAEFEIHTSWPRLSPVMDTMCSEYSSAVRLQIEKESLQGMDELRTKIHECLNRESVVRVSMAAQFNVGKDLVDNLRAHDIDTVVLKKRHKSWLEQKLIGHVSDRVLELFKGNILVT